MNGYLTLVAAAIHATEIRPPLRFSWFGKFPPPLPRKAKQGLLAGAERDFLQVSLRDHLYSHFYCKGFASPLRWESGGSPTRGAEGWLVDQLAQSTNGRGSWESGWKIVATHDDQTIVRRDGLTLRIAAGEWQAMNGDGFGPGAMGSLRLPSTFPQLSPGFYLIAGDRAFLPDEWPRLIRLYWHVTAAGAARLVRSITRHMNQAELPFRLKVVNDVDRTERCDAAVLYLREADYPALQPFLQRLHAELSGHLRPGTPVFTKQLAAGLGLAEDPGSGVSFGLDRCQTMAEGMVAAHEEGRISVAERLTVVTRHFAEAGIDLDRPYLRPGSSGDYPFHPDPAPHPHSNGARLRGRREQREPPLATAATIGRRLCDTAIWHQDRCTWIGPSGRDPSGLTFGALGPDFYAGTSGVAWFLADLAAITADNAARRTALGAIRHALARIHAIAPASRVGLYSGWLGVALAATHVGVALEEPAVLDQARVLVAADDLAGAEPSFVDLMAGSAGGIIGLLALNDVLGDPSLVDTAIRLGNDLLRRAVRSDMGASWRTINAVDEYHLTGLAHGAAGIALALVELFQVTNDARYRAAADLAFAYERHWFDATQGNWPDLREATARITATTPRHALAYSTYWCHGAPGIGLSRLRAHHILRDPRLRLDAAIALGTTRQMIEESLPSESVNFSLCHGLAGNAEVLLLGAHLLPDVCPGAAELAAQVGATGAQRHSGTDADWPSGAPGGLSPSLMLGLAGIGHFYLRLHDPSLPSALLPRGWMATPAHS